MSVFPRLDLLEQLAALADRAGLDPLGVIEEGPIPYWVVSLDLVAQPAN